jgi:hypothetical protein
MNNYSPVTDEPEIINEADWKLAPYMIILLGIHLIIVVFAIGRLIGGTWFFWLMALPCAFGIFYAAVHMLYNHFLEENAPHLSR